MAPRQVPQLPRGVEIPRRAAYVGSLQFRDRAIQARLGLARRTRRRRHRLAQHREAWTRLGPGMLVRKFLK